MTPREWAVERRAVQLRWEDEYRRDIVQAYTGVVFYSQALAGKLQPLEVLLRQHERPPTDRQGEQFRQLSTHLGVPIQKISPEALAALERLKARDRMAARG